MYHKYISILHFRDSLLIHVFCLRWLQDVNILYVDGSYCIQKQQDISVADEEHFHMNSFELLINIQWDIKYEWNINMCFSLNWSISELMK